MIKLSVVSTVLGLLMAAGRMPGVVWPDKFRAHAMAFPRSLWWGRILMGLAAIIAGIVVFGAAQSAAREEQLASMPANPLGAIIHLILLNGPVLTIVGFPTAYFLVIQFGRHFLALRGAAALTLLAARVMVAATDRNDEPLRLIVTTLAYVWVVAAIWMAIAPHHFRDVIEFLMATNRRCRAACAAGVVLGFGLVLLGLFVY